MKQLLEGNGDEEEEADTSVADADRIKGIGYTAYATLSHPLQNFPNLLSYPQAAPFPRRISMYCFDD